jgi:guanylate kinase
MSLKNIYLIVGPSGSGKTSIANELRDTYGYKAVESYTPRHPRYPGERGHIFVSDEEFDALGPMCAYTEYDGYRYGVTDDIIDSHDIYVIDPYGVKYLAEHYEGNKLIVPIRIYAPWKVRLERMRQRGDSEEDISKREFQDDLSFGPDSLDEDIVYRMTIPNNDFTNTVEAIYEFIQCWEGEE